MIALFNTKAKKVILTIHPTRPRMSNYVRTGQRCTVIQYLRQSWADHIFLSSGIKKWLRYPYHLKVLLIDCYSQVFAFPQVDQQQAKSIKIVQGPS